MLNSKSLPQNFSFYDDFDRADTPVGDLGSPPLGYGYYLAGPDLIHASSSKISGGRWVPEQFQATYLGQRLDDQVANIGARLRWTYGTGYNTDGLFVLLISAMGNENMAWNCIHIRNTRYAISVDVREHNNTIFSKSIGLPYVLSMDLDYTFDFDYDYQKGIINYNVEGITSGIIVSPLLVNRGGLYPSYEHYYNDANSTTKLSIDSIWAGTK